MKSLLRAFWLAMLLTVPAIADDWTHLGREDARLRAPSESILLPAPIGAPVSVGAQVAASLVAADGYLVVADLEGSVRAYRESDRAPLWTAAGGGPILSTPVVDRGQVYVPTGDGEIRVFRLADGALLWTMTTGGAEQSSPVLSAGTLYVGAGFPNAAALAIDVASRSLRWSTALDQVTSQSPALAGGMVIIGSNGGTVSAIDASTGLTTWTYAAGGTGGPASPLVDGSSIYLVTQGSFQRVDLNPASWASGNWTLPLADPAPPGGALAVEWASSSPALAGGLVVFTGRFTYPMDDDFDGYADRRVLREFAFAVNPSTQALAWQIALGTPSVPDVNGVPPSMVCPSPVSTGAGVAFASSVDASLRVLSFADGSELISFPLDAPCLASPILANARLYAVSRAGTLYAYEGTVAQPGPATGLSPDAVEPPATPPLLTWDDSGPGSTYVVRMARDGELLMNWDFETVVATNSTPCPPMIDGFLYTWGVRVRSASGAYGPWSLASFGLAAPPLAPGPLTAIPDLRKVFLSWTASPSPGVAGYRVTYGPTGGGLGSSFDVGNVLSTVVSGLTGLTNYTFEVRAIDHLGHPSPPATALATPLSTITIAGTQYATIAGALAAAQPGDVVEIAEDTLQVTATLQIPRGVVLRGASALGTRLEATGPFVMIEGLQGSTIERLSLSGGSVGVNAVENDVVIVNCVIRDMADAGVTVSGTATIVNNTIVGNAVAGIRSTGPAQARNNILQGNGVGINGVVDSTYNVVADGYAVALPGIGDLSTPVVFLDTAAGDYREQPNQPSLDAGAPGDSYSLEPALNGGRINMGAFGNTELAATSLTAGSPPPSRPSRSRCGLTGLEVLIVLALIRRRR